MTVTSGQVEAPDVAEGCADCAQLKAQLADLDHAHEKLLENVTNKITYIHELIGERNKAENEARIATAAGKLACAGQAEAEARVACMRARLNSQAAKLKKLGGT